MRGSGGVEEPAGLQLAKQLASWGIRVIPAFCSRDDDKIPLAGKDWAGKATVDWGQLEKWWDEKPWARVGIVSGLDSCWLLDCDGPAAVAWWREFVAGHGGWAPGTLCYRTPGKGGGLHVLYKPPRPVSVGGWYAGPDFPQAKVRMPGGGEVQLRGKAHWALVIGPPRASGAYELVESPGPGGPIEMPARLFEPFMASAEVVSPAGPGDLRELTVEDAWAAAPWTEGRKNAVAGLAWALSIRGGSEADVLEVCERFAMECCSPALDLGVVRRKVAYTWQRADAAREKQLRELENMGKWTAKLFG